MKTLEELLLEDFILEFFGKWSESPCREHFINTLQDAFPKNEICEEIREIRTERSCWCCYDYEYHPANYIKD